MKAIDIGEGQEQVYRGRSMMDGRHAKAGEWVEGALRMPYESSRFGHMDAAILFRGSDVLMRRYRVDPASVEAVGGDGDE